MIKFFLIMTIISAIIDMLASTVFLILILFGSTAVSNVGVFIHATVKPKYAESQA